MAGRTSRSTWRWGWRSVACASRPGASRLRRPRTWWQISRRGGSDPSTTGGRAPTHLERTGLAPRGRCCAAPMPAGGYCPAPDSSTAWNPLRPTLTSRSTTNAMQASSRGVGRAKLNGPPLERHHWMGSMALNELGKMLTAAEVAHMLHLHVNTVKRLGDRGELKYYQIGRAQ